MSLQLQRRDPFKFEGFTKKMQPVVDLIEGGFCDQAQIHIFDEIFKQDIDQRFNSKCQPESIEFHFVVAAVHRRDINCKMPFFINIFTNFIGTVRKYQLFQVFEVVKKFT